MDKFKALIEHTTDILVKNDFADSSLLPLKEGQSLPDTKKVKEIITLVRELIFPGFFSKQGSNPVTRKFFIGMQLDKLYQVLREQICNSMVFTAEEAEKVKESGESERRHKATEAVVFFFEQLPEIKRKLYCDVQAMFDNDPAAQSKEEVVVCYPSIQAMLHYRVAHELLLLGAPLLPRIITELAHSATGIDIHPGAKIGERFSIDHGTGVVIGETAIIGNKVHLYKGVTLGAKNFVMDERGCPINVPRHPIIEDNVVIYSNATVLGRITIGHDSVIGGNVWLTNSVPPHSRIVQSEVRS
jgi:serine O-acetyltransferase